MTKMEKTLFQIEFEKPVRLDRAICLLDPKITRAAAVRLIESGNVTVNGKPNVKSSKVVLGDRVEIVYPEPVSSGVTAQDIPLDIVYEDSDLLVVDKPKGMVVHPAAGNPDGTLVNALLFHCKESLSGIGGVVRPGIVHRIDKDTSGLLIVAKNDLAHIKLSEQIKEHSFTREYEAVIVGHLKEKEGTVDAPIGRSKNDRKKMAVTGFNSKNAVTHYKVIEEYNGFSYVGFKLETGRTHQIRVHMAYLGHPLAGDGVYGGKNAQNAIQGGQCLHARKIGFIHPTSGEYMEFCSDLPEYFTCFLEKLRNE